MSEESPLDDFALADESVPEDDTDDLQVRDTYEDGLPDEYEPVVTSFFDERIRLDYWQPRLEDLGIPTLETHIFELEEQDEGMPEWDTDGIREVVEALGGEAHIRSMYKSAIHLPKEGGYIATPDNDHIDRTIAELLSQHVMGQLKHGGAIAVREWLDLNFCNYARDPLHPEVRTFIEDGEVKYMFPRMKKDDFVKPAGGEGLWETALEFIDNNADQIKKWAYEAAQEFDEAPFSLDFVMDTNGDWYATDMAVDGLYFSPSKERWHNLSEHDNDSPFNLYEQFGTSLPDPRDLDDDEIAALGR